MRLSIPTQLFRTHGRMDGQRYQVFFEPYKHE